MRRVTWIALVCVLFGPLPWVWRAAVDALNELEKKDAFARATVSSDDFLAHVMSAVKTDPERWLPRDDPHTIAVQDDPLDEAIATIAIAQAQQLAQIDPVRALESLDPQYWSDEGARRLAELGAKKELAALIVDGSIPGFVRTGLLGLALLGDEKAVRRFLEMSVAPGQYVATVVEGGMPGLVLDFAVRGRIPEDYAAAALSSGPPEYLTEFMVGPVDGPATLRDGSGIELVIDYLREERDVKRLIRTVDLYENVRAIAALLELGAYEEILDALPRWRSGVTTPFFKELQRITGIPEGTTDWPKYTVEQQDLITRWRAALAASSAQVPGGGEEKDN